MVARRDEWISVEDFLALDRENLVQVGINVIRVCRDKWPHDERINSEHTCAHLYLDQKYELINGEMVAMAGGTVNHGTMSGTIRGIISS